MSVWNPVLLFAVSSIIYDNPPLEYKCQHTAGHKPATREETHTEPVDQTVTSEGAISIQYMN